MKLQSRINYLHHGDSLPLLLNHVSRKECDYVLKSDFFSNTFNQQSDNFYLRSIISSFGEPFSKKLSISSLVQDVDASAKAQKLFRILGCRGFSHKFVSNITGFSYRLRSKINLRVAIISSRDLFYPKRVRRHLQRNNANHCFVDGYPAIAFALGRIIGRKWFILIMQSDIAFSQASYIRDHFRGWRKILFASILRHAAGEADSVFLSLSSAIMNGTFPDGFKPQRIPDSWRQIYDGTAQDFNMNPLDLPDLVDIQIYSRKKPVYCRRFYELKISAANEKRWHRMFRNLWLG